MQTDKILFKVKNKQDKTMLENILVSCFKECDFQWDGNILLFESEANDGVFFELKENVISLFEESGSVLSCLMVPFFNEIFYKYMVSYDNKVHTAYEAISNNVEDIKAIKRSFNTKDLETIEAFLKCNGNLCKTAEKLYLHRNSMNYRMNQFVEETGINIRNIYNLMFLALLFC